MAEYANHHFNSYIPEKDIEEQLLTENLVTTNLQQVKLQDDFIRFSSWENLKEVPFSNNSQEVPLASMTLIHPVVRKLFTEEILNSISLAGQEGYLSL